MGLFTANRLSTKSVQNGRRSIGLVAQVDYATERSSDEYERSTGKVATFKTCQQFYELFDHLCVRCHLARSTNGGSVLCRKLAALEAACFEYGDDERVLKLLAQDCQFRPASSRVLMFWHDTKDHDKSKRLGIDAGAVESLIEEVNNV